MTRYSLHVTSPHISTTSNTHWATSPGWEAISLHSTSLICGLLQKEQCLIYTQEGRLIHCGLGSSFEQGGEINPQLPHWEQGAAELQRKQTGTPVRWRVHGVLEWWSGGAVEYLSVGVVTSGREERDYST